MSLQQIPCFSDASWVAQVTLEGKTFGLQMDYNQRSASWYLSLADAAGVDIYNGVKVVTGFFSLLAKCKDPRAPAGWILCVSNTSDGSPPQQYELLAGARCSLLYLTSDWVALLGTPAGQAQIQAQLSAGTQTNTTSNYGQGGAALP